MRSILTVLLLFVFAFALPANEEAIKKFIDTYHEILLSDDPAQSLKMIHSSFLEVAADGTVFDIEKARNILESASALRHALRDDSSLLELLDVVYKAETAAASDSGSEAEAANMPITMRQQIFLIQYSPEGRQQADILRQQLKNFHNEHQAKLQEIWKSYRLISVKIQGDRAQVVYEMRAYDKDCDERTYLELVKINGEWLAVKSISEYITPENQ